MRNPVPNVAAVNVRDEVSDEEDNRLAVGRSNKVVTTHRR